MLNTLPSTTSCRDWSFSLSAAFVVSFLDSASIHSERRHRLNAQTHIISLNLRILLIVDNEKREENRSEKVRLSNSQRMPDERGGILQ